MSVAAEQWDDVALEGLNGMLEGRTIASADPLIFEGTGLFQLVLTLDDGLIVRFDAIALHGMDAAIGVSVPAAKK